MSEHSLSEMLSDIVEATLHPHEQVGESRCPYDCDLGTCMSNFDGRIEPDAEDVLKKVKGFAWYTGWNFNGRVWYDHRAKKFKCEVWHYGSPVEIFTESTLKELMASVQEVWGDE